MTVSCPKCGAPLGDADAFCMKCGAARPQSADGPHPSRFCASCGSPLEGHTKFCSKCGAAVDDAEVVRPSPPPAPTKPAVPPPPPVAPVASPPPVAPAPTPAAAVAATPGPAASTKSSPFLKIVAVILGIIAFVVVIGIGSCVYIGYRIEHKVRQVAEEVKGGGKEGAAVDTSKYESRPLTPCEFKNRTGFDEYTKAAASASIPLKAGMTLTDVWPDPKKQQQDIEILHTVQGVHSSTIEISSMRLDGKSMSYSRNLCIADMINGRELETQFGPRVPQEMPGTTMFSLSRAEFDDLKAGRPAAMMYYDAYFAKDNTYTFVGTYKGTFSRIEPDDVPYSVIVNGERKDLPTIHMKGTLGIHEYEAWVLDDAANPLILNIIRPKDKWHITYLKITFPVEKKVEQDIAKSGCAAVYGIYFDFNSAALRSESGPALKEIADALRDNPAWNLKIEGHTDNIGGDAYNMTLSGHRASAVGQALVKQYHIPSDRLTSEGYGATKPKAPNDTPEGRALNRRVEVCRQ